jgi:hypothetical protein
VINGDRWKRRVREIYIIVDANKTISYDIYNKNVIWKKKSVAKYNDLKIEREKDELKECSFTPKLSKSSKNILCKSQSQIPDEDFYKKNLKWKQNIEIYKLDQHV